MNRIAAEVSMRKITLFVLATTLIAGSAQYAVADTPGKDWMPAQQATQKLLQSGYSSVTELVADDGHWEGEGIKNGRRMEFHAAPKTCTIISEKTDD
jgi:hypothetical protein